MTASEILMTDEHLIAAVAQADEAYHDKNESPVSDAVYDGWRREMARRGLEYSRVGFAPSDLFAKVKHNTPCMSLGNLFEETEVLPFITRCMKAGARSFIAEAKVDGLSLTIRYVDGRLCLGSTRGDGTVGEDVTPNAMKIEGIPHSIETLGVVEVRGEAYMPKSVFRALNEERLADGRKLFANTRNGAAGAVRNGDAEETARRGIRFFAYTLLVDGVEDAPSRNGMSDLETLRSMGFETPMSKQTFGGTPESQSEYLIESYREMIARRDSLDYDIDGIVYKVCEHGVREEMGFNSREPLWAIAHKFPAEQVQTNLTGVRFQVGRTGALTPVGLIEPVSCGGVMVSKATLHNMDHIAKLNVEIGSRIIIQRAGDVVPQIVSVVPSNAVTTKIEEPAVCPSCSGPVIRLNDGDESGVKLMCENARRGIFCADAQEAVLNHYVSRDVMNVQDFGDTLISDLVQNGALNTTYEVFDITPEILASVGRGDGQIARIMAGIKNARKTEIRRIIAGLSIDQVSLGSGKKLAEEYRTIDAVLDAMQEQSSQIIVVLGQVKGGNLLAWATPERVEVLRAFIKRHLTVEELAPVAQTEWTGKKIVLTGSFAYGKRPAIAKIMEGVGASVAGSVSKKTDFLIYGEEAGSNLEKARKLGVTILSEAEWVGKMGANLP